MIYIAIADGFACRNKNDNEKWDCRVLRQPQNLLPKEVTRYIENTGNEGMRSERYLAYTTLSLCLKEFFSVSDWCINRTESGKPYLTDISGSPLLCRGDPKRKIYMSLSHSEGMVAVALSDEGEIGVDIQTEVDEEKAKRLEQRFLSDIGYKSDNIDIKYFYLKFEGENPLIEEIYPKVNEDLDFLSKWTSAESVIKYYGLTFSEISKINELSNNTKSQTVSVKNCKITTTIAK